MYINIKKIVFSIMLFSMLATAYAGGIQATPPISSINDTAITQQPESGKALIVFMQPRVTCVGRTARADGIGVTPWAPIQPTLLADRKFVGYLYAHSRIAYQATPGKHQFMVAASDADLLTVDVSAGKTYYVYVKYAQCVADGAGVFRFVPQNGQMSQHEIDNLLKDTYAQQLTDPQVAWFKDHVNQVLDAENYSQSRWQQKATPSLKPQDGV